MATTLRFSGDVNAQFTLAIGSRIHIGRGETSEVRIDDLRVSRLHCFLELQPIGVTVSDLGSTNGIYVNGEPVSRALLRSGDELHVGAASLVVELAYDPPPTAATQLCSICKRTVSLHSVPERHVLHLDERFVCPGCRKPEVTGPLTDREVRVLELLDAQGFSVLSRLSVAGFAPIYKARKRGLDQLVAIKALLLAANGAPVKQRVDRFLREAKAGARLRHPNLVTVFDAEQTDELIYIVMELIEGTTLQQKVQRGGPLALRETLLVGYHVAHALEHLHEHHVVHRDVTPANIMITAEGDAKLIDLGSAKTLWDEAAQSLTDEGQTLGTLGFIAPELFRRAKSADARADIYGLGATLYYALTGESPRSGADELRPGSSGSVPSLASRLDRLEVPPDVVAVLRKMLEPDPRRRFSGVRPLLDGIERVVAGIAGMGDLRGSVEFYLRLRGSAAEPQAMRGQAAIHGRFAGAELATFVTMLEKNDKMGVLELSGEEWRGKLHLQKGRIVAAEAWRASLLKGHSVFEDPIRRGKEAALVLLASRNGAVEFTPTLEPAASECDVKISAALLEALAALDEREA